MIRVPKKDIFRQRTVEVTVFLLFAFAIVAAKLYVLQVVHGPQARLAAENQHSIYQKIFPSRGEIFLTDRDTDELLPVAVNIKKYLVYAVPPEIKDATGTAEKLEPILGMAATDILPKLLQADRKYVPIKKQLTEEEQQRLKGSELAGIYLDSEDSRFYPQQNLLSQVVGFYGYKGNAKAGLYGLERYFEKDLAGQAGELHEEKDTNGAWIFGSDRRITPAQDGTNLILTVDKNIQFKAESVLKDTVAKHGADSGSVIVVDPKTGAVLAMANYPDFNPNEYNKTEDPKVFMNDATMGNYEPGSVFKPLTMAAAIDEGKVTPDTTYEDTGTVVIDNYPIKNSDLKAHGTQTMTQVLELSLNTGAIFAKDQIGNAEFFKYVKKFGFGKETGIELPEMVGNLDNLKADIKVNYATASFGQGISVTPIQMIQAFTALANEGKMMRPFIVKAEVSANGKTKLTEPKVVEQVVSAKTANMVTAMLVNVVENGHGKKAGVPGYYIAGKTGTAQVPKKDGRGYEPNNNIGSFIGYGPVENPRFLMLVRINHPRDVTFAESTAAPAFGELAQFILNYYHIPPTRK